MGTTEQTVELVHILREAFEVSKRRERLLIQMSVISLFQTTIIVWILWFNRIIMFVDVPNWVPLLLVSVSLLFSLVFELNIIATARRDPVVLRS